MAKLEMKIKHNSKCEREIYSKMFIRDEKSNDRVESVTDYVERNKVVIEPTKTVAEKEIEAELVKIDSEV